MSLTTISQKEQLADVFQAFECSQCDMPRSFWLDIADECVRQMKKAKEAERAADCPTGEIDSRLIEDRLREAARVSVWTTSEWHQRPDRGDDDGILLLAAADLLRAQRCEIERLGQLLENEIHARDNKPDRP